VKRVTILTSVPLSGFFNLAVVSWQV